MSGARVRSSLRGRLVRWSACLLLLVVSAFGGALWVVTERSVMIQVDARLSAAAEGFDAALKRREPTWIKDRPYRKRRKQKDPLVVGDKLVTKKNAAALDGGVYAAVLDPEGRVYARLPYAPADVGEVALKGRERLTRTRDGRRELIVAGPHGSTIVVGRGVQAELESLAWLAWRMAFVGAATLAAGMASAWWLAGRLTRPVAAMCATAEDISASNLSRRIDSDGMDRELGRLAEVLNGTFARLQDGFEHQARFTADASHELRTPLTVLLSHVDLALTRERTPEQYRDTLGAVQRAAQRMRSLVHDLLDLSRLDAGALVVSREPTDLARVARDALDLLRPAAQQAGVDLQRDLTPCPVLGDADRLHQVVVNLVANAIRHGGSGGHISVRVSVDHTQDPAQVAVLTVTDNGSGIAPEHLPHVFERFHRADASRSRGAGGGSGLGLAIAQALVAAHGGTISASSPPGEGATFEVRMDGCEGG